MEEKRPTAEQMAKFKKNAQDKSLSAEIRAKFQAIVDKFSTDVKDVEEKIEGKPQPKKRAERKPATSRGTKKPATSRGTKKTATDIEQAKAEIKAKTGKTEEECEAIIEQYRELRSKAQQGKIKAEQANADNKKRVEKLDQKGDLIEGTNVKTADAVIESTAKDVAEKIEQQIEAVEDKAEKEAKAEVAKDTTIKTPKDKKDAVKEKVDEKVKEGTKVITERVVIDTSALLTSIATSLGKFDKDSQKEFLIKLRSDINKLLAKYAFGGMTNGAVQTMNIQQSNLSSNSVNPTMFANGGGIMADGRIVLRTFNGVGGNKNKTYKLIKDDRDSDGKPYYTLIEDQSGNIMAQGDSFDEVNGYANLMSGKFAKGGEVGKIPANLKKRLEKANSIIQKFGGRPITEKEAISFNAENKPQSGYDGGLKAFLLSNAKGFEYATKRDYQTIGDTLIDISTKMSGVSIYDNYYADGGVVGQEIVFDDSGEENTGVIKDITNLGDYIVKADDGRTLLAQRELDVISLGAMRSASTEAPKKRFGFFDEGGNVSDLDYSDILSVLEDKLDDAVQEVPSHFENSYNAEGQEVEHESRDGFIPYTDGGYEVRWFEYLSYFSGSGYSLPTSALDKEKDRQIEYNYTYAKERFMEEYPEIVEELGEENIDYNSLYDADYGDEAEQLSEWENDYDGEGTIMCEIGAYYYSPNNDRGIDGKHTLRLFGLVNLESPYHRSGNLEDRYDIDITFDSIEQLEEKVEEGLKEITEWFDGSKYNESTEELRIRRMAKGGMTEHGLRVGDKIMGESKDLNAVFVRNNDQWHNVFLDKGTRYAKGGEVDENIYFAVVTKKGDKNYDKIGYSKSSEFIEDKQGNKFDKLYFGNKKTPTKYNAEDINYSVIELDDFTSTSGRKFILLKENTEDGRVYYYILHSDDKSVYTESYDMDFIKSELKRLTNGKNFYAKAGVNFAKGGKLWIDTKTKGGLKGVKPSRKNSFTRQAQKRGITSGQLASKVLANPSRYKGINPKSAQLVKNMGVRKHGGSIGDILRNRRGM
jgi:hypothetical protein